MSSAWAQGCGTYEKMFWRSLAGCLLLLACYIFVILQPPNGIVSTVGRLKEPNEQFFIYLFSKLYSNESDIKSNSTGVVQLSVSQKIQLNNFLSLNKTIWNAPGQFLFQEFNNELNRLEHQRQELKRVCYYSTPKSEDSDYLQPEDLDPFLCTHITLFVDNAIVNDTIQLLNAVLATKNIARTVALRAVNPELKILLSLTAGFSELVANRTAVRSFAYNARVFVEQHDLDGLDLDWEFPAWSPDPQTGEKGRFVDLVDKLSTALRLVQPSYLLTAAVTGIEPILDNSYDIPGLARNLDFLSLMSYDYHMYKPYLPFTGHNAPLRAHYAAQGYLATLNVEWSVQALLQRGLPKEKLVVGVPIYGRTWRLVSSSWQGLGAPASGPGFGGGYVTFPGAEAFRRSADVTVLDTKARVPYAARGMDWVSYESVESASEKASWVRTKGLAGVMTFNLNSDDWAFRTGLKKFPLHSAIKKALDQRSTADSGSNLGNVMQADPLPLQETDDGREERTSDDMKALESYDTLQLDKSVSRTGNGGDKRQQGQNSSSNAMFSEAISYARFYQILNKKFDMAHKLLKSKTHHWPSSSRFSNLGS